MKFIVLHCMISQESSSNQTPLPPYTVSSPVVCLWWFIHRVERIGWHPVSIILISWVDVFSSHSGTGTLTVTNPIWVIKTRLCLQYTGSPAAVTQAPQYKGMIGKKEGNLANLTFAKTYGTVTRDREKNWPIADWRVPSNNPRNNCGTHFRSRSLVFF